MKKYIVAIIAINILSSIPHIHAGQRDAVTITVDDLALTVTYGMSTHQNKRDYQEDRFSVMHYPHGHLFGIYDGHGGAKTSSLLQSDLAVYFAGCFAKRTTIKEAFECAFATAEDYAFNNFDDGSTAVVAYIDKQQYLHYAWVGDSRAVLENNGRFSFSTHDHKPDRPEEKRRIERAGGTIQLHGVWRVNGLAVSRSIGDRKLKNRGKGQIIAIPEYTGIQLNKNNHFMIIASDGLWDVIKNQEAIDMVTEELKKTTSLKDITEYLQNEAMRRGSEDNITICIVKFDWVDKKIQPSVGIPPIKPVAKPAMRPAGKPSRKQVKQQPTRKPTKQQARRPSAQQKKRQVAKKPTTKQMRKPTAKPTRQPRRQPTQPQTRQPLRKRSFADFATLVKTQGEKGFIQWNYNDRMEALEEQYPTIYGVPDSIRLFLLGSDEDRTIPFRMQYKDAALEKLEEEAMMRQ